MSIERQAEEPGTSLLGGEMIKYRLSSTAKATLKPKVSHPTASATPGKDVLYTLVVFAIGVGIIIFLSITLK